MHVLHMVRVFSVVVVEYVYCSAVHGACFINLLKYVFIG